jgi:nitroreductase
MAKDAASIHELFRTRRSIRKFKPDPIPNETLERITSAACWAPSAMDRQPWKFYVLTDEMRDRLATIHQPIFQQMEEAIRERYGEEGVDIRRRLYMNLGGAPVAVACFADKREEDGDRDKISAALAS